MQQRQLWRKEAVGQKKSSKTRVTVSSNARPSFGLTTKAENRWTARSTSLRSSSVVVSKSRPASGPHSTRLSQCTPRAQSSLGFSRGTASGAYKGSKPIGFDIAQYLKLRGSAANVRIGINGDPSATDYFRNYVRECQVRVKQNEDLDWDLESESDTEAQEETFSSAQEHPVHMRKPVPLCWEDQIQDAEPSSLKIPQETFIQGVQIERKSSTKKRNSTPPKLALSSVQFSEELKHMSKYLSVMLSSSDSCITSWRDLREASSRTHNVHVPSSQYVAVESDDRLDHFLAEDDDEDKQMASDLPTEANHRQLRTELLPKLSRTSPERIEAGSSLCIWLEVQGLWLQEELSRLEFDVFVTATSPGQVQPSTKAFTKRKAKRISDTIYVFTLDLPWRTVPPPSSSHAWAHSVVQSTGTGSHMIRVSVVCCNPRIMLFCVEAKIEPECPCSDNPAMEGTGGIPQKFFHKRSSYCDQEEDEDMTDMRAIARQFPDLRVLGFDGSSLEGTPFSSPAHQSPGAHRGTPFSSPVYQSPGAHRGTPFSSPVHQSPGAHRALTKLVNTERQQHCPRSHFRPSHATTSTCSSYVDVVRQWLKPYLDH